MRCHGDIAHDLLIEPHAALDPAQCAEQLIVVSFAPAQPATLQVKGHSREPGSDPVALTQTGRTGRAGSRMPNCPSSKSTLGSRFGRLHSPVRRHKTGQGNSLASGQRLSQQRPDIQFLRQRRKEQHRLRRLPQGLRRQQGARLRRSGRRVRCGAICSNAARTCSRSACFASRIVFCISSPQGIIASHYVSDFGLRTPAFANCARHFSTRSLIFFSTPCSVGS